MNYVVMHHAHKDQRYAQMELSDHVLLVVAINSIGYWAMTEAVMRESGQQPDIITQEFLKQHDDKREYNILHNK